MSFSFFTLELYSSCSLSLYGLTETGRKEPSFSPSQTCRPGLPAFPLPRPLALSGLPAPMTNFAVTAWGFALVKCTNVPKGQLRMCLVGEGSGFSFFFLGSFPSLLLLLPRLSGLWISAIIYLASMEGNRAELPPQRGDS